MSQIDVAYYICDDVAENRKRIEKLKRAGVRISSPELVYVGPEVPLELIEADAVLVQAIIRGFTTTIGRNSLIGTSGTAVVHECQIGRHVEIGAGSYRRAVLLDAAKVRGFAELREGTVLEEESELGHNVGLKNTLFSAGVVAGSSINFCDVVVTGGSSRQNHTEIGSGCVHMNYDPHGDKFGSAIGGAEGVLLRSSRIFVGGNSALVAPVRLHFGAVVAAGSLVREDVEPNKLYMGHQARDHTTTYKPKVYGDLRRKLLATADLCGDLQAMIAWYEKIRLPGASDFESLLYKAAVENIWKHARHRSRQLARVFDNLHSAFLDEQNAYSAQHSYLRENARGILAAFEPAIPAISPPHTLTDEYMQLRTTMSHVKAVTKLSDLAVEASASWLRKLAGSVGSRVREVMTNCPE